VYAKDEGLGIRGGCRMASLESYRQIIKAILTEYAQIPYAYGHIQTETVFDRTHDRYLLVNVGWDKGQRVHGAVVHVDIIDGKL
jgi:XisI protein